MIYVVCQLGGLCSEKLCVTWIFPLYDTIGKND